MNSENKVPKSSFLTAGSRLAIVLKRRAGSCLAIVLKRRTDADAECTEDGRDERIGATEYAEGNRTRKRGGEAEHIT